MSKQKIRFTPHWIEEPPLPGTYRSLLKWGAPDEFKHPNRHLYRLLKDTFGLLDADFETPKATGFQAVDVEIPGGLEKRHLEALTIMVGEENILTDTYHRIQASYGKGMIDDLRLRHHQIENLPDAVICPRSKDDVEKIVAYCHAERIPLYVRGAGSSVTRGTEAVQGGITLDMSVYMKRVLDFNEQDQTITVEAGMNGPQLEKILQNAKTTLNGTHNYTCGHFPQSFEFSSVGGWVVTRGAGQNSTYYGKIEDIVIAQEYITPVGIIKTPGFPRKATGPDMDQILLGSEGAFGVLVNVTLKVCRSMPENRRYFAYMYKTWDLALVAAREIMQGEGGLPSVFRLSDAEETEVAMNMYGMAGTPADTVFKILGYQPMQRCLMIGTADGEKGFARRVNQNVRHTARKFKAFDLSLFGVVQQWENSRFRDPYLREDLHDFGICLDTLECAVTWSQLKEVYQKVRDFIKQRPRTICMTHCSHFYPQGTNLYFIFIANMDSIPEYLDFQYGILETISQTGAAISHHHGIGKQTAPWFAEQSGEVQMAVLHSLKNCFDPHGILNPGGTLGLDMSEEQARKQWGKI
ncbi:MAG: FAD-binding oxidoreductase [Chloroflexi bacterium]|nr:FAD-binding oxidoreductase [Chloroflexota bacterium]